MNDQTSSNYYYETEPYCSDNTKINNDSKLQQTKTDDFDKILDSEDEETIFQQDDSLDYEVPICEQIQEVTEESLQQSILFFHQ